MAKLNSYTFMSLNGFYKGEEEDINWHQQGEEEIEFSTASLKSGNTLLFGRATYEMMKSFWASSMAREIFPDVAKGISDAKKIVVSKTLQSTDWANTTIISDNIVENINALKIHGSTDITLIGSGSLLKLLSEANLIDEYQIMLDPVFIKSGQPIINNLGEDINLKLTSSKMFKSGTILLNYAPVPTH